MMRRIRGAEQRAHPNTRLEHSLSRRRALCPTMRRECRENTSPDPESTILGVRPNALKTFRLSSVKRGYSIGKPTAHER